ncbi:MAG: hypothetical protein K2F83_00270 [Oscillospiraceae bacterium]|nr:hypothetical protein [Oscillospiraceae bacterium]
MWGGDQDAFLESMGEAGKSVVEALDGKIVYINIGLGNRTYRLIGID